MIKACATSAFVTEAQIASPDSSTLYNICFNQFVVSAILNLKPVVNVNIKLILIYLMTILPNFKIVKKWLVCAGNCKLAVQL